MVWSGQSCEILFMCVYGGVCDQYINMAMLENSFEKPKFNLTLYELIAKKYYPGTVLLSDGNITHRMCYILRNSDINIVSKFYGICCG